MQSSFLCVPPLADWYHTDEAYDPIVEFLRADLKRARWMLQQHIPHHGGWCYHQGAFEKYRWPCQLFQCAHDAMMSAPPHVRDFRYPVLKRVSGT